MKINYFKNIIPGIKIYGVLLKIRPLQLAARRAREAGDMEAEREAIKTASVKWARDLFNLFGASVDVQGYENLPESGPVVFVSNHQSYGDIPTLCNVLDKFQFGFLAKEELERIPLYSQWMRDTRCLFLTRNNPRAALGTINEGIEMLQNGYSFVLFAEGTRSQGRPMAPFKKGSLKLATKAGVPIIPITLSGCYKMFEAQGYFKGQHVNMIIHPMIETKDMSREEINELPDRVYEIIHNGLVQFEPNL